MKKFTESLNVSDWQVETDNGYVDIEMSHETIPYEIYKIKVGEFELECADNHIVFDVDMNEVFVKDLLLHDTIMTKSGPALLTSISKTGKLVGMYDLQLPESSNHRYYTNDILSHNTTIGLDMICNVQRDNPKLKVLFISGEMNKIDMYEYMERYPKFGEIDILFLSDYVDENPKLVIEEMLDQGYDLVLGDSFVEIQDSVKEACFMTSTASEKWLINLMCHNNEGNNKRKSYTTFLMIQQVTKGGKFVGSNKLKHNTTGMIEIRFAGNSTDTSASRYIEFSKNRRGEVNKKLHFSLKPINDVAYNENKWNMDEEARTKVDNEIEELTKEAAAFDVLLKLTDAQANAGAPPAGTEGIPVLVNDIDDEDDEDI